MTCFTLFSFNKEGSKAIVSLLNIVLIIIPLISIILGTMYYYNVREFIDLLLCQPVKRYVVFSGIYAGLSGSLIVSFLLGTLISYGFAGPGFGEASVPFLLLLSIGVLLTLIFTGIAFWISIATQNKIKGIAISLFTWLFMALLFDGLFLLWIIIFGDYPVEKQSIVLSMFNPIDLSRIIILLKLDTSALMGYTGAVFLKFFGTARGIIMAYSALLLWVITPLFLMIRSARSRDF